MGTKMTKAERELMDEKFAGVIAMIQASNDMNKLHYDEMLDKQHQTLEQTKLTNGRVTNIEKRGRVFFWLGEKPFVRIGCLFLLCCALFIKESRDFIFEWLKIII